MDHLSTWIKRFISTVSGCCACQGAPQVTDSAKPAEWYLNLATECMKRIRSEVSKPTEVKLYLRQCGYLAEQLETAIKNSRESLDRSLSPEHKAECLGILKLLYLLAKEVESFIRDCCNEATWMQAALTAASVPGRVSSWGCRLKLCTELLCNNSKLGAAWHTSTRHEGLGKAELLAAAAMASKDVDDLMKLLESLSGVPSKPKSNALIPNVELATILLGRLKATRAMSTEDSTQSSLQSSYLEGTGGTPPWQVDAEGLRLLSVVGQGSTFVTFKAEWFGAMVVAVGKLLEVGDFPTIFQWRLATGAGLSHPNIVSYLGYTMQGRSCSIVRELMDENLCTLMARRLQGGGDREGPFNIWEACDIMLQVAEGVSYMHENRVVHRDLKSTNILVRCSKVDDAEHVCAKVCDFWSAKRTEESTTSELTLYTGMIRWRAPELIPKALLKHPFKSDVFSFGILCYEILTGDVPFLSISHPREVRRKVVEGVRPELPRKCPQSVKNLVELCWDLEPVARPTFAEICDELRYIRCSLLLEPLDHMRQPTLPILEALDLPREVSNFKGDYSSLKVLRQLGRGGSDIVTVYLSTWLQPDNAVAQKRFIGSHNECFVNEVSIMADLKHPNVVSLLHYATDRRSCSIVMELMDEDLHDLMRRRLEGSETPTGPFPMNDAVCIILQIARGMEYVHGKNVVHRDLKSCNILVRKTIEGEQLEVKVADFGLSKKMASRSTLLAQEDSGVGTVRWMAPEVMGFKNSGLSNYDPFKSDVFSFGMLCYEILGGRVPFHEIEDLDEVRTRVLSVERPTLPEWILSSDLKELIENCWQDDALKRPSFVDIVKKLTHIRV